MSLPWIVRGLLVGLGVAGLNHWMTLATIRQTDPKDPFANQGGIIGGYILRLFSAGIVLFIFREHTDALLTSLLALTVPHKVFLAYRIFKPERREGEK